MESSFFFFWRVSKGDIHLYNSTSANNQVVLFMPHAHPTLTLTHSHHVRVKLEHTTTATQKKNVTHWVRKESFRNIICNIPRQNYVRIQYL